MWIKICGLTTREAVEAAVSAGADAIGFVFAPSKRRVSPQRAAELARDTEGKITRVAVMLHPTQQELDVVSDVFGPDVLQTDTEDVAALRIPSRIAALPVIRGGARLPEPVPQRLLFEGAVSGTGDVADWAQAAVLALRSQIILAGGLNAKNVGAAIAQVRPYGVDVSSGVESAPGCKDPQRIREFICTVRALRREEE